MKDKKFHFELLTRSWKYLNSFRVTNSIVKVLLFCFRVTNSMWEILFSHVRVTKIWKILNCIWNYWIENWKKTECWSRFIVIRKLDMLTFELLCLQFLVLARFIVCKVISAQAANDYVWRHNVSTFVPVIFFVVFS